MTNDCKTCPVSTGTHKPAEAVHQIDEPQADALRLAAWLLHRGMSGIKQNDIEASNQLRWLHAESLQHKQELAAYRFTVENREARIAELETQHREELRAYEITVANREARIAELESQVQRAAEIERAAILLRVKNRAAAGALLVKDFQAIVNDRGPAQAAAPAPDERAAFEAWLGIKPCGAAHDFGWAAWQARAALAATQPAAQGMDARDAAFEAVRKAFCKLQRYSFALDSRGNLRRCADHCGNWVEFEAVHTLFEPQSVDAVLAAQAKQGGAA